MAEFDDNSVSQPERFPLDEEDRFAIDEITHIIRGHTSSMSPSELRSAATVLLALKRLPYVTYGVHVSFGFSTPNVHGTHRQADIEINEEGFRLGLVEYFYDPAVGGDTEARYIFETMAGTSLRQGSIEDWLESAEGLSNSGLLTIEDLSDYDAIDWSSDDGIEDWNKG